MQAARQSSPKLPPAVLAASGSKGMSQPFGTPA